MSAFWFIVVLHLLFSTMIRMKSVIIGAAFEQMTDLETTGVHTLPKFLSKIGAIFDRGATLFPRCCIFALAP